MTILRSRINSQGQQNQSFSTTTPMHHTIHSVQVPMDRKWSKTTSNCLTAQWCFQTREQIIQPREKHFLHFLTPKTSVLLPVWWKDYEDPFRENNLLWYFGCYKNRKLNQRIIFRRERANRRSHRQTLFSRLSTIRTCSEAPNACANLYL